MTYVVTYVDVQPDQTGSAGAMLREYVRASRGEAGNSGVALLQESSRPARFVIVEGWDEPAFQLHENAAHTLQFRSGLHAIHNSPYDQRVHHVFAVVPARMETTGVFVAVTHVDVPPPRKDEAEILLKRLAEQSRTDEGNVRYDVYQQNAPRTNHFTIFAGWVDAGAFASNQASMHTRQFRNDLGPLLGAPYDERLYGPLNE